MESCTGRLSRLGEDKIESEQRTLHMLGYLRRKLCKRRGPTFAVTSRKKKSELHIGHALLPTCEKKRNSTIRNTYKAGGRHNSFRFSETGAINTSPKTLSVLLNHEAVCTRSAKVGSVFFERLSDGKASNQMGAGRRHRGLKPIT